MPWRLGQEDSSNLLADFGTARLARRDHRVALSPQVPDQRAELRALAGSVRSLERDEYAAITLQVETRPLSY